MPLITYVFSKGRISKFNNQKPLATEFYYGAIEFLNQNYDVKILEFTNTKSIVFKTFDKILNKFLSLPFSTSQIIKINNLKLILNSKNLILINENVGFSVLPMLLLVKYFKKINVTLFVMGLYSKKIQYPIFKSLHFFIIKILTSNVDQVFFLGKGELEKAKYIHKKSKNYFYFPFHIDFNFWKYPNLDINKNSGILFVGNDGNRDPKTFNKIAHNFPDINFTVVSNINEFDTSLNNLNMLKGNWESNLISDIQLKQIYSTNRLTVIPLLESSQPSGQSVALQSMSVGIPVLINKTEGFWDDEMFKDNFNIFFIENNNIDEWTKKINQIYFNLELLEKVSKNARNTVNSELNMKQLFLKLKKFFD